MQLRQIDIQRVPNAKGRVQLTGEVIYDDRAVRPEIYWFEVPEKYAEFLSKSGNPWLVCLLPLAVTLGEPLRISQPVDSQLFENAQELMRIWKCWYPHLHIIPIEGELIDTKKYDTVKLTASFFSGGVDSFFSVLWHGDNSGSSKKIHVDDLLFVHGFDVPLENINAFSRIKEMLQKAAGDLGKELIDISTNLRRTTWNLAGWHDLSHGSALGSVALALEERYSNVLIPSTHGYGSLHPLGSHVLTDPLLSTNSLKIIHDGASFNRVEKTEFVAKSEIALRTLRVCWRSASHENCCSCTKCYRTMLTLELIGALEECSTFEKSTFDIAKIRRIYSSKYSDICYYRELQTLAVKKGRLEIAEEIKRSFKNSERLNKWLRHVRSLRKKRFVWRFAQSLERAMLKGYIT